MDEDTDMESNKSCDGSFALSNINPQQRISSSTPTSLDENDVIGYNEDLYQAGIKKRELSDYHFRGKEAYAAHICDSIDNTYMYMYNIPKSDRCDDNDSHTHRHEIGEMAINNGNNTTHFSTNSNNDHTHGPQIKREPNDFKMGKINACTGTIFGENVMDVQTDECLIKDEPYTDNTCEPSYCMPTEQPKIDNMCDASGCLLSDQGECLSDDETEKGNSHGSCNPQMCLISNDMNYADCMKNEPYAYDYEFNKKFGSV